MKRNLIPVVTLLFSLPALALAQDNQWAMRAMDGQWRVVAGTWEGFQLPNQSTQVMGLQVTGGQFESRSGNVVSKGSMQVDGSQYPGRAEIAIQEGDGQGTRLLAIFRVENQILTLTFSFTDEYPTTFDTNPENKYLTLVYAPGQPAAPGQTATAPPPGGLAPPSVPGVPPTGSGPGATVQ